MSQRFPESPASLVKQSPKAVFMLHVKTAESEATADERPLRRCHSSSAWSLRSDRCRQLQKVFIK